MKITSRSDDGPMTLVINRDSYTVEITPARYNANVRIKYGRQILAYSTLEATSTRSWRTAIGETEMALEEYNSIANVITMQGVVQRCSDEYGRYIEDISQYNVSLGDVVELEQKLARVADSLEDARDALAKSRRKLDGFVYEQEKI